MNVIVNWVESTFSKICSPFPQLILEKGIPIQHNQTDFYIMPPGIFWKSVLNLFNISRNIIINMWFGSNRSIEALTGHYSNKCPPPRYFIKVMFNIIKNDIFSVVNQVESPFSKISPPRQLISQKDQYNILIEYGVYQIWDNWGGHILEKCLNMYFLLLFPI